MLWYYTIAARQRHHHHQQQLRYPIWWLTMVRLVLEHHSSSFDAAGRLRPIPLRRNPRAIDFLVGMIGRQRV